MKGRENREKLPLKPSLALLCRVVDLGAGELRAGVLCLRKPVANC
jgi:hypothetical protein